MIKQPNMRSTNSGLPMDVTTFSFAFDNDKRTAFCTLNCYIQDTDGNNNKTTKTSACVRTRKRSMWFFLSCHMPIDD